ncbi:MAG: site-specific integrase [Actinobacteria bacterium]|nr:site-specific integrase [Actinomycetota bacterium]
MAWARKKASGRWQGQYRDPSGRSRSVGTFMRKGDALAAAEERESAIRRGAWLDPERAPTPFGDYARRWLETKGNVRPRTRINVEGRLRNHVLPAFGDSPIAAIGPSDVRTWVANLSARGLAPSTVKATYRTFSQIMTTAAIDGLLVRSPCIGVELPAETGREEMHFLNSEQARVLADKIDDRYRVAILTAAYTGLRAGELWALKLSRVNLLKRRLEVVESLSEVRGELVVGPTKTRNRRTVTLPAFLAEMVGEHVGRYPSRDGYIFTAAQGGPVRHHNFMRRHFYPAAREAGMPDGLRFHDLRHSCAAILTAQGWNPKQIQTRLGHATIRTTLDRYGHLFEGHDDELLDKLDATVRAIR